MRSQVKQRLKEICDVGCAIVIAPASEKPSIAHKDQLDDWVDLALKGDAHPSLSWLEAEIGLFKSSQDASDDLTLSGLVGSPFTLVATYEAGVKVGVLAAHSNPELSDVEIRELTAAALILTRLDQIKKPEDEALTAKEQVYLQQVSGGALDDDIADDLGLSLRAIKERKRKAIEDMQAKNISHAVAKAKRNNLL